MSELSQQAVFTEQNGHTVIQHRRIYIYHASSSLAVEELPGEVADVVALEVEALQRALVGEDVARHALQRAVRQVQLRHLIINEMIINKY